METSPIYELLPAFKDRNDVIYALMGLLSLSQEWLSLLEEQASASQPLTQAGGSEAGSELPDEYTRGFVYFLLGTVSFTTRLTSALESSRQDQPAVPADNLSTLSWGDASAQRLGELLR